ncbi:hypothetical protein H4582DRAFT_1978803 [Lactarius indigo]|nr:hypothetical protein H4582DRAFT_1978803 [Lactarius indigo]
MSAIPTSSRRVFILTSFQKKKTPCLLHLHAVHNDITASRIIAALTASSPPPPASSEPSTHFRVTLRRSGISLGKLAQGPPAALGLRRRTMYDLHTPEAPVMILPVKELVEVENVLVSTVRMSGQQRAERKAPRGLLWLDRRLGHCDWLHSL